MINPEIIKVYRNWCRDYRLNIRKCIIGFSPYTHRLTVWTSFEERANWSQMLDNIKAIDHEINCYASPYSMSIDPGDVIIFHEKSCKHYNSLAKSGNLIDEP